jgi:hypothetical protein
MRREEAINIVKEIGSSCKLLNPSEIDLEENNLVGHYEIYIKSSVDEDNWQVLKAISKKYGLGIKLTDKSLIIYKAKEQDGNKLIEL